MIINIPTPNDIPHIESMIHRSFSKSHRIILNKSRIHISNAGIDSFILIVEEELNRQYPNGIPNTNQFLLHSHFLSYRVYLYNSSESKDGILENLFCDVCKSLSTTDVLWGRPKLLEEKNAFRELNFCRITKFTYAFQIDTPTNLGIL